MEQTRSWAGFRTSADVALAKLQLHASGETLDLPDAPLSGLALESGWYVVVANDLRFLDRARLEDLSFDCEVVTAGVQAGKISQAQAWRSGALEWAVLHDGSVNRTHLQMEGAPPREVHGFIEQARAKKHPFVDHFLEIPVQVVEAVLGFHLGDELRFERLVAGAPPWRAFRHADGRMWSIRAGGNGYQLRIGDPSDDPVLKERPSSRPLRDIEALIAEQAADGFAPAK